MDELQISGKRYISSRRIARENGYTADYIGQLIRGGKVAGQKVGRAWYVDAASFDAFLGSASAASSAEPSAALPQEPAPVVHLAVESILTVTEIMKEEEQPVTIHIKENGLRYYADEAPLLPEIVRSSKESRLPESAATAPEVPHEVFSAERTGGGARRRAIALAALALIVFVITAVVSSTIALNINVGADNTASTFYTIDFKH